MSITRLLMPDWMFASIGRASLRVSGFGLRLTLELQTPKNVMGGLSMPRRGVSESEPCLEEIAYALDRALRKRETDFPVIGIFPESLDRNIIPSAIATDCTSIFGIRSGRIKSRGLWETPRRSAPFLSLLLISFRSTLPHGGLASR